MSISLWPGNPGSRPSVPAMHIMGTFNIGTVNSGKLYTPQYLNSTMHVGTSVYASMKIQQVHPP